MVRIGICRRGMRKVSLITYNIIVINYKFYIYITKVQLVSWFVSFLWPSQDRKKAKSLKDVFALAKHMLK